MCIRDSCSKWERQEDEGAGNHFNCPIVMSYSEALRLNIDELNETDVEFLNPFVPYDQKDHQLCIRDSVCRAMLKWRTVQCLVRVL